MSVHRIHNETGANRSEPHGDERRDAELHNLAACAEIGGIADANGHYSAGLSRRIAATGRSIEALTVGELLALHRECGESFNRIHGAPPTEQRPRMIVGGASASSLAE